MTWEWDPEFALRSTLHPSILAAYFAILKGMSIDYRFLVMFGPNIIHTLFMFVGDVYFYKFV